MRAVLTEYEACSARSLEHALELLVDGAWRPFAGGTDLMVLLESGKLAPGKFINISHLSKLRGIEVRDDSVVIGALTTYADVLKDQTMRTEFPNLWHAAGLTGAKAIQSRGTVGGNIANASPAADSAPALLVYDAGIELVSMAGTRTVAYSDFHTGYKNTVMRPDELIARVILPRTAGACRHYYHKVGTREAQSISKVCLAGCTIVTDSAVKKIRLAAGAIGPTPLRCKKTEALIECNTFVSDNDVSRVLRDALPVFQGEISPIDDIRSSALYRRGIAANLLEELLRGLL